MCGIIGYIGNDAAKDIIIHGLEKLEYRGYDSAGIILLAKDDYKLVRSVGKITNLKAKLDDFKHTLGMGHTRWATHGVPNETNCHPHYSSNKQITIVHNGVIENYLDLKNDYLSDYSFYSDTDTEVLANLLEKFMLDGLTMADAIIKLMEVVEGSYALGIIDAFDPNKMYVVKNKSPMLIGVGSDFNMLGSDALAMINTTNKFLELHDKEYGILTRNSIEIFDASGNKIKRDYFEASVDGTDVDKGIYEHYMLKEIYDQPTVIRKILQEYYDHDTKRVVIDERKLNLFKEAKRIYIIAAGTSYYAGLVSQSLLEHLLDKPVFVHIASEFAYDTPYIEEDALFVFVSQSGETADLRSALVKVKALGHKTFTITNVDGSTLAREVDDYLLLHAGREIAVASTKAFVAQVTLLNTIGYAFSNNDLAMYDNLTKAANGIESIFEHREQIEQIVLNTLIDKTNCFYIGRGIDSKLVLEGALKLKEISYINTIGMSSGELKHGTIALIEEGLPVFALITQGNIHKNTRSGIQEIESRGAKVTTIAMKKYSKASDAFVFDDIDETVAPLVAVVIFQLIAYYTALHLGKDIDMPRNLAKSVTVE